MNSRFSVFPKPAPVLSHITQRRGSDSSHNPTVREISAPGANPPSSPARKRKTRRWRCRRPGGEGRSERGPHYLPRIVCVLFFFFLSLRARVRPSSLPSEPALGCLIKKSSVSTVTKKKKNNKNKPNQKKKFFQKAKTKRERRKNKNKKSKIKQTNKQGRTNLYFKPAGTATRVLPATQRGGSPAPGGGVAGTGGQRPSDALGATGQEAEETRRGERDSGPPRAAARGWGARSGTGAN